MPPLRRPAFHTPRATSLSSWVAALKRAVDAQGHDGLALMSQAGMDVALLADPLARYPSHQSLAFWKRALEATGNPLLGLDVARQIAPGTFHALGYALMASGNLQEMFERLARYFTVVTDAGELRFTREQGGGRLTLTADVRLLTPDVAPAVWCVLDAFMLALVGGCRLMHGSGLRFLELRLQRPVPQRRAELEAAFGLAPVYGCEDNALLVDEATLLRPLVHGNAELARWNEEAAGRYLARLGGDDILSRLRRLLQERLPGGDPTQEELAACLALTPRTLQRKLADAGTSYRELLNDTRHMLALEYLRGGRDSISEIAYLLGFAEVSAFTRAFKRWTGVAPSAWRDDADSDPA
ncbi:MAG TPA: AraC family transcriptional regulator [Aquabacterium sp.]|uniref:AraC family transcriptional regulator n=1 Tax=Aquabacterium sp. TaxID=1872578 RepID=UPI002E2FCB85|nr:AraC family transcriptional regulator [Aquabacterium sp.]HEX5372815.1 AraC family transcriptional regulator [Aquabacterium sp.]